MASIATLRDRRGRWALAGGITVLAASVGLFLIMRPLGHGVFQYPDFEVYREAGRRLLDGRSLYDTEPRTLPFTYPPFAALVSSGFALLPRTVAGFGWMLVNVALLVLVVRLSFRRALDRAPGWTMPAAVLVGAAAMFWIRPVNDTVDWGQINLLLLVLVLVDGLGRSRLPRGLLVGVATAIKLVPGIFVGYFAVTRQWRAAFTAVAGTLTCMALAFLVAPASSRQYWSHTLFESNRIGDSLFYSNQSLLGIVQRTVPDGWVVPVWLGLGAVVVVLGFRRVRQAHDAGNTLAALAITGLLGCLCSPIAWVHHFVWMVPVVGVLVDDGRDRRRVLAAVGVVMACTIALPYVGIHLIDRSAPLWLLGWVLENSLGLLSVVLVLTLPFLPRVAAPRDGGEPRSADRSRVAVT